MITFATVRSVLVAHKYKISIGLAALLVLITCTLLLAPNNKPKEVSTHQTPKIVSTQKGSVLGANTATSAAATADTTAAAQTNTSSRATTPVTAPTPSNPTPSTPPASSDPTPPQNPTPPNPCDAITTGGVVTAAEVGISFTESVTIPVGCTTPSYTVKTTDGRTVTFSGFTDKPTAPAHAILGSTSSYAGNSATYVITASDTATPGYYEDFAFIQDPSLSFGGFAFTVKITVVAR